MATNTPRLGLTRYDQGETGWDHTDIVNLFDELAIDRGTLANRPASGDYDGQLYFANDTGEKRLYRWDSGTSSWNGVPTLVDGDDVVRRMYVVANGAGDPAAATANDLIFEEEA